MRCPREMSKGVRVSQLRVSEGCRIETWSAAFSLVDLRTHPGCCPWSKRLGPVPYPPALPPSDMARACQIDVRSVSDACRDDVELKPTSPLFKKEVLFFPAFLLMSPPILYDPAWEPATWSASPRVHTEGHPEYTQHSSLDNSLAPPIKGHLVQAFSS